MLLLSAWSALAVDVMLGGRWGSAVYTGSGTDLLASFGTNGGGSGISNWAVQFDGQNYAETPATDLFTMQTSFTVEAFIRIGENVENGPIFQAYSEAAEDNYGYKLRFNGTSLSVDWYSNAVDWVGVTTTGVVAPGVWTHVAMTWDGTTVYVFLGGVFDVSFEAPTLSAKALSGMFGWGGDVGAIFDCKGVMLSSGCKWTTTFSPPSGLSTNATTICYWPCNGPTNATALVETNGLNATFAGDPLPKWVGQ